MAESGGGTRRRAIYAAIGGALCVLVAGCSKRASYPLGAVIEFKIQCAQYLWPGPASAALDVREAFCACLVKRSEQHYDLEQFDRIRIALHRGGYRPDAAGVPPEFIRLGDECRGSLDRGTLKVQ